MNTRFSLPEFNKRFPDDDACLEELKEQRYPDGSVCPHCNRETKFHKITGRTAYSCQYCRGQVFPLAGTIFEKTTTPLTSWFFAMYSMAQTRSGMSAKQLERMLGITYKTAWRMFKQIRMLMADTEGGLLDGDVEIDETYVGGKGKSRAYAWTQGIKEKQILMGMVKRGGKAYIKHIPSSGKWALLKQIQEHVDPKARVITDEWRGYTQLPKYGYLHEFVNHGAKHYVRGDVHTQSIENIWSHLKRGIYGVYRIVSKKYLQAYADEYAWRYNNRHLKGKMFDKLLRQVTEVKVLKLSV